MNRYLSSVVIVGATAFGVVGCSKEASVTNGKEVTIPGGTTTVTEESKLETTEDKFPQAK